MNLDLKVGDVILGGKFKNKRIEVESIGTDEIGQPIINGDRKLLAVRIEKTLPEGMWSSASLAEKYKENDMDKKAFLEQAYNSAFKDELEKIALSAKTLGSYALKRGSQIESKALKSGGYISANKYVDRNKLSLQPGTKAAIRDANKWNSSEPVRSRAKLIDLHNSNFRRQL